eukprot:1815939-Alexandrium_andersonii.AAC.1
MTSTPRAPTKWSIFFCVCAFKRSLAVCRESVIKRPLAEWSVLPRDPKFCAAWLDCAVAENPTGPKKVSASGCTTNASVRVLPTPPPPSQMAR